ncbi:MAG: CPBP family glutamic-type intramembrane protease [Pseudomonadota bacterium]
MTKSTVKALFRPLTKHHLRDTGIICTVFSALALIVGASTSLFQFEIAPPHQILRTAFIAFVFPALLEELVFRGPLIYLANRKSKRLLHVTILSLALFILWHPLNAWLLLTDTRPVFLDWRFLTLAALLGVCATTLALRTRSLWPPILFHWLAVVSWKAFLGAPAFL